MSLTTVLLLFGSAVVIGLLWRMIFGPRKAAQEDPEIAAVEKERADLREAFYSATQAGEKTRDLVRIYSQTDIAAIESLLASEGIAIMQLTPHRNILRTEVQIPGLNDCVFVVLERDYAKAIEILKDYNESMKTEAESTSASTAAEEDATGATPDNPTVRKPELL
jgi:hypothetical protein